MNLRDLWDNVILRDILGYIVPGLVTLFAIAVLLEGISGTTLPQWVTIAATKAGLGFLDAEGWTSRRPWVAASLVVPLAYTLGHLQAWIADYPEKQGQPWFTGSIALEHLQDNRLALAYYCAATRIFPSARSEDLRQSLLTGLDYNANSAAADAAKGLFLLCDRYVLYKDRDLHSMFMGRYYILAVLFTNLGISSVLLGISLLGAAARFLRRAPLEAGTALALLLVLSMLIAVGVLLLLRSRYFRGRFVECTFPIFYAIVQGEERSKARQA